MEVSLKQPETIDEAVNLVLEALPQDDLEPITTLGEQRLPNLHFSLGVWIRNYLQLHSRDCKLIRSFADDADSISYDIIVALWHRLRKT